MRHYTELSAQFFQPQTSKQTCVVTRVVVFFSPDNFFVCALCSHAYSSLGLFTIVSSIPEGCESPGELAVSIQSTFRMDMGGSCNLISCYLPPSLNGKQ